jgi:hypothetical protein
VEKITSITLGHLRQYPLPRMGIICNDPTGNYHLPQLVILFLFFMLKKLFLSLVVLIGLVLIIAYFLPRDFRLSKSVVINAPRETVYDYVRFLKNQEKYSVWVMADPNVKMTYT